MDLLFSTQIHVNINEHTSSDTISQPRGICQNDNPIAPRLFNAALELFLGSNHQDSHFQGFRYAAEAPSHSGNELAEDLDSSLASLLIDSSDTANLDTNLPPQPSSPPEASLSVKILAYADDTLVYLYNISDFFRLQIAIATYMAAFNAKLNFYKTVALSLSGKPSLMWHPFLQTYSITQWHNPSSAAPLIYSGYSIAPVERN